MNIADFVSHKQSLDTNRTGDAMREGVEVGTFNTAPYKEWLGVVACLILAALICVVLFAGGVLS